ncbi:YncE family protein [Candidatus Margulisiibacteriota bacterium]
MIRKIIILLIELIFIFDMGSLALTVNHAYVLRYNPGEPACFVQFDVNKDEIVREIPKPRGKGFNNFIVDEKGGCYIADLRSGKMYGRGIYYYDPVKDKIKRFARLGKIFGPSRMVLTDKELIVQVKGNDRTRSKSGVVFIDRETGRKTGKIFLQEDNPELIQANINNMFFDGEKYLFLASFYQFKVNTIEELYEKSDTGDIYVIDVKTKKLVKIIDVDKKYKDLDGICNVDDKIYIAAATKGKRTKAGILQPNDELLVYSFSTGKLIKKIKITPHARSLVYDKSVGKIYVLHTNDKEHRNTIEIIDVKTDKIIGKLYLRSQLMFSVVGPGKMYMTVGPAFLRRTTTKPRLLVLDTKTDKFIKQFEGGYQGISVNPKY